MLILIQFLLYCYSAIILSPHFYHHISGSYRISGPSGNSLKKRKKEGKKQISTIMFVVLYRNMLFFLFSFPLATCVV